MKRAAVINRGEHFVTLRATTENPAEIREALQARDVQHVFKGDQNQAWDAVLANHCLSRALNGGETEVTLFVQDERLGTSDVRLARLWRKLGRRYVLTEDYYRGRSGAVWEHQDVSHGLFFTEAVSPEQFAEAGIHLHRAAELWEKHHAAASADGEWVKALSLLGVALPTSASFAPDRATRLGPAIEPGLIAESFEEAPSAALYYAFTKTDGLYGVVPVENDNATLSSIPALHPEMCEAGRWLLVQGAARGAMRLAGSAAHRRSIKNRARSLAEWAEAWAQAHPEGSVTDFQIALAERITGEVFPADQLEMDRASHFMRIEAENVDRLLRPEETLHFFLDLALRHPREFTEAYNEALNRVGYGLQRMKFDEASGQYTPPFFVEWAPGGEGTTVYRYGLELSGGGCTVTLTNRAVGDQVVESEVPVRSAHALARALIQGLPHAHGLAFIGKAATFAAELQRAPRGLGLPRQGSKYAPMVDHLVSGLRTRGVLDQPTGLLIRIGLNTLDRLEAMGELTLRLPRFLEGPLGRTITCRDFAARWRETVQRARGHLEMFARCEVGQHVHLAKLICLNVRGLDLEVAVAADARLAKLVRTLEAAPDGRSRVRDLGRNVPPEAVACLERLLGRREVLLAERRALVQEAQRGHSSGRLQPSPERMGEIHQERERIDCQLLLIVAAYVRRLWQRVESLPYVNDRPYTLALYLLFGSDIFAPICRNVEFDVEYVSPTVGHEPAEPEPEPAPCGSK